MQFVSLHNFEIVLQDLRICTQKIRIRVRLGLVSGQGFRIRVSFTYKIYECHMCEFEFAQIDISTTGTCVTVAVPHRSG